MSLFGFRSAVVELWKLVPVQHDGIFRGPDNFHVGLEDLRRIILDEENRIVVVKAVPLSVFNNHRDLVERAEHNHCRSLSFFFRLFFQQSAAKVHILGNLEIAVRIEKALFCEFAFSVLIVPARIPHGI